MPGISAAQATENSRICKGGTLFLDGKGGGGGEGIQVQPFSPSDAGISLPKMIPGTWYHISVRKRRSDKASCAKR